MAQVNTLEGILNDVLFNDGTRAFLHSVPLQATIGNEWSDPYIGALIDVPPHFGVGVTAGIAFSPLKSVLVDVQHIIESAGGSTGINEIDQLLSLFIPLPAYSVDLRFGFTKDIPLEIGIKAGYLPLDFSSFGLTGLKFDYLMIGGDIRYAFLKAKNIIIPDIIIGVGYSYVNTGIHFTSVIELIGTTGLLTTTNTPQIDVAPQASLSFGAHVLEAKLQAGWRMLFFEPFLGISVYYAIANMDVTTSGNLLITENTGAGSTQHNLGTYSGGLTEDMIFGLRTYGGFGLKLFWFHLDFGAGYEVMTETWSASVGARFQL